MPSQRKRIGFLPRSEVQNIIDEICKQNKLSQSKVTGILVDEALNSRGLINCSIQKLTHNLDCNNDDTDLINHVSLNRNSNNEDDFFKYDEIDMNDDFKMIKEFIEFKFFKKVMNKNKKI